MGYLCLGITFQQQLISEHVVYVATDQIDDESYWSNYFGFWTGNLPNEGQVREQ